MCFFVFEGGPLIVRLIFERPTLSELFETKKILQ